MSKAKKVKKVALNHVDGSRKSKVHSRFDVMGPESAFKLGVKLGLKETTLRSWFVQFRKCLPTTQGKKRNAKVKAGVPVAAIRADDSVLIPAQA